MLEKGTQMMNGQSQLVGLDWGEMGKVDIHDLILANMPEEEVRKAVKKDDTPVEWEVAFKSGADVAIRRIKGTQSTLAAFIVAKSQFYVRNERTGVDRPLTGARIASFFKGCEDETMLPWFAGKPGDISATDGTALLYLLGSPQTNALIRKGMFHADSCSLDSVYRWLKGRYTSGSVRVFCREFTRVTGNDRTLKMILGCAEKRYEHDVLEGALSALCGAVDSVSDAYYRLNSLMGYMNNINVLLDALALDSTRKLVERYLADENDQASPLDNLARGISWLKDRDITFEPKVLARYALNNYDRLTDWYWYVREVVRYAGGIHQLYPQDPEQAYNDFQRRLRIERDAGVNEQFAAWAAMLANHEISEGEYMMRLPRYAHELEDEGQALHHCVGGFISRHAANDNLHIYFMRKVADPDTPFITVETKGGAVVQAHGLQNRNLTPTEKDWLVAWARKCGYKCDRRAIDCVRG